VIDEDLILSLFIVSYHIFIVIIINHQNKLINEKVIMINNVRFIFLNHAEVENFSILEHLQHYRIN
jgi:hypothetical protein